jgi:aminopeptidase 2
VKSTLGMLLGGEVKDQDIYMPAAGLRSHPEGIEALYCWMEENWEEMYKRLPPTLSMLGSMVKIMTSTFATQGQLDRVEKFFADKDTKGYDQALAQSMDAIRSKVAWLERDAQEVAEWMKKNGY